MIHHQFTDELGGELNFIIEKPNLTSFRPLSPNLFDAQLPRTPKIAPEVMTTTTKERLERCDSKLPPLSPLLASHFPFPYKSDLTALRCGGD